MRAAVIRTTLAATALAAAGVVGVAPTAQAGSCTSGFSTTPPIGEPTGGWARCIGYSAFHVEVECFSNVSGLTFWVSGPTATSGNYSRATCPSPSFAVGVVAALGGGGGVE